MRMWVQDAVGSFLLAWLVLCALALGMFSGGLHHLRFLVFFGGFLVHPRFCVFWRCFTTGVSFSSVLESVSTNSEVSGAFLGCFSSCPSSFSVHEPASTNPRIFGAFLTFFPVFVVVLDAF